MCCFVVADAVAVAVVVVIGIGIAVVAVIVFVVDVVVLCCLPSHRRDAFELLCKQQIPRHKSPLCAF